jgi:hypothetical protein
LGGGGEFGCELRTQTDLRGHRLGQTNQTTRAFGASGFRA